MGKEKDIFGEVGGTLGAADQPTDCIYDSWPIRCLNFSESSQIAALGTSDLFWIDQHMHSYQDDSVKLLRALSRVPEAP